MTGSYLVIGDTASARESLAVLLRSQGHTVTVAPSAADAIRALRATPSDAVLIIGSENDVGARKLRNRLLAEQCATRVLLVSRFVSGAGAGQSQRFSIGDYRLSESELLALVAARDQAETLEHEPEDVDAGVEALVQVVDVLVGLRELNDRYHRGASHRATFLARTVAERMHLSPKETLAVVIATLLRDLGKVGIQDIEQETGVFNKAQRTRMQEHVTAGVRLLEHIEWPWTVLPIVRHHHESYDGTGYPDGLRGPEIPLGARIVGAVDAYIAMLSDRPHRPCKSSREAQEELVAQAGRQYDPEVVEVLLQVIREGAVSLSSDERPRVLIAEPDREFVKLLKFRLVNEGMDVESVKSLEEGILEILERPPSIVLATVGSDPDQTLEQLRQIREDSALRLLPVVLLAEADDPIFKVRAFRLGADDFLLKTVGLEEMVARIEGILAREAMRRSDDALPQVRGITGRLENLALPDIVQILNLGLKTARVSLQSDDRTGTIWFESGTAVHAESGEQTGVEACYAMLAWNAGAFCIEHGQQTDDRSIEMDTMFMVMEGLRQLDEAGATA